MHGPRQELKSVCVCVSLWGETNTNTEFGKYIKKAPLFTDPI